MDCQMPGMNGFEATTAIRAQEGDDRHTPIIALTAGARAEDRDRCLSKGMDGYLAKPVNKIQLLELLSSFTEHPAPYPGVSMEALDVAPVGTTVTTTLLPRNPSAMDLHPSNPDSLDVGLGATVPADPSEPPALDEAVLRQLTQLGDVAGEDLVGKLAVLFLEDADLHLSVMREAVATSDVVALSRSAHTLSGSSANLGATELARLCGVYGSLTGPDLPEDVDGFLPAVECELERVRTALATRTTV
jgi:hypothetical protein